MNEANGKGTDVTIGVVGDGFGALLVYVTAVYVGFRPEQIGVFGESTNPVGTYQQFAWNLGQTVLRSESESHFLPADWPTFGQMEALARRDPSPLFRSVGRKFNPGVPEVLAEATIVWKSTGYESRVLGGRKVGFIVREPGPPPYFTLDAEDASYLGRCRHLMLAIGHGPLAFLGIYGKARENPEVADRVVTFDRRHRRRLRDRLRQVGPVSAAASAPGQHLRRPRRAGANQNQDELRRTATGSRGRRG